MHVNTCVCMCLTVSHFLSSAAFFLQVLSTMKLKDSLEPATPTIKLPGKRKDDEGSRSIDVQFRRLQLFARRFLVGWNAGHLWLVERHTGVLAGVTAGVGDILDVCTCQRWLYVLREPPYAHQLALIRLALDPSVVLRGDASPSLRHLAVHAVAGESPVLSRSSSIERLSALGVERSGEATTSKELAERAASPGIAINAPMVHYSHTADRQSPVIEVALANAAPAAEITHSIGSGGDTMPAQLLDLAAGSANGLTASSAAAIVNGQLTKEASEVIDVLSWNEKAEAGALEVAADCQSGKVEVSMSESTAAQSTNVSALSSSTVTVAVSEPLAGEPAMLPSSVPVEPATLPSSVPVEPAMLPSSVPVAAVTAENPKDRAQVC